MGQPGNCGNGIRPYRFSLDDLKDVAKGSDKQMEKGCAPDAGGEGWLKNKGFGWPDNGEFEWGGLGSDCRLCDGEYGCECPNTNAIGGKRGKVKRRDYKADPRECCLANMEAKDKTKTIGDYTCDPTYRNPGNTDCGNYYRDYCKESNNLFNPNCQALSTKNEALYKDLMTDKCNTKENYTHEKCIVWCNEAASNSCHMLKAQNDCKKYQITEPDCTQTKINDLKTLCAKYKLEESDLGAGVYACNLNAIKTLEDECTKYNIQISSCTTNALEDEKNRVLKKEENDKTRSLMESQFQRGLEEVLNIEKTKKNKNKDEEDYTMYIIITIILVCIFMSSSSIVSVLLTDMEVSE
jgi:hypothetical protein